MAQRYMYVRVPVEQGLAYMIKTRLEWMESEKKAEIVVEDVNELCFENKPKDERLNEKKCKLLDFLQFSLKMVIEEKDVFIQGQEAILGNVKEKVGTLSAVPSGWSEFPFSLQSFNVAVLARDLIQEDSRLLQKTKSSFNGFTHKVSKTSAFQQGQLWRKAEK